MRSGTLRTGESPLSLLLWLLLAGAVFLVSLFRWPDQGWLATDFQALLPLSSSSHWVAGANRAASSTFDRQVVWLIESRENPAGVGAFAESLRSRLAMAGFTDAEFEVQQGVLWSALSQRLYPFRWGLMTEADRTQLEDDPSEYFRKFQRLLYSPLGAQSLSRLESDPTGHFAAYLQAAALQLGEMPKGSGLEYEGSELLVVTLKQHSLGFDALSGFYNLYRDLQQEATEQGLSLYATGVPLYSAYGVHSARFEVSTIGLASLAGLILLLLRFLGSGRALILTLLCVGTGIAGGCAVTVIFLQEIHILTLVFGATLIGIAADYALHYFSHSLLPGWSRSNARAQVSKGLLFSMVSSFLAFGALLVLPFPGIRQMGLFMSSGLLCSFLTVYLVFPLLYTGAREGQVLPRFCAWAQPVWRRSPLLIGVLLIVAALGIFRLPGVDEIRSFYAAPDTLQRAEALIQERLQVKPDSRYLLVQAASSSELLEVEEALFGRLATLQMQGALRGYQGISQLIPSPQRQEQAFALWREINARNILGAHLQSLGFDEGLIAEQSRSLLRSAPPLVGLNALNELELPAGLGGFLGCDDSGCASWVRLAGIDSIASVQALANQYTGVSLVDPVADINAGISRYRVALGGMLAVAVCLTFGLLCVFCGWRKGLQIIFVPVLACAWCLLLIASFRGYYSIINLMALLLVLGVSLDYAIFRAFTKPSEQAATTLAITLSALTSTLAFGMLSFSSTPLIEEFGLTIAVGLVLAYSLSWLRFDTPEAPQ